VLISASRVALLSVMWETASLSIVGRGLACAEKR
jgi:hypothetical protein